MIDNIILKTDSYKLCHWQQYPEDCEVVYSYLEARKGAQHSEVLFFGLQYLLKKLEGVVITQKDIEEAAFVAEKHLGDKTLFNREGWEHILNEHGGMLPIRIKAVPEGTLVPVGNVLMTIENTGGHKTRWLTNALETLLMHVWYPTTVATLSHNLKQYFLSCKSETSEDAFVDFMLHDFGYRGVSSCESAGIGGAAHLVSFKGTDTLEAMVCCMNNYKADLHTLAFSVPATEHSVMTAYGEDGEFKLVSDLIDKYPTGILSVVCDSYNATRFIREYVLDLKDKILNRQPNELGVCKFVIRPDSLRSPEDTPAIQMMDMTVQLDMIFGHTVNSKGYKVINSKVGLLWGDGIDPSGIKDICNLIIYSGYSVDHLVFGMGGGLLQKVNRDTGRFAFKCSAQYRDGKWIPVQKSPLDKTKASKGGRMKLYKQLCVDVNGEPLLNDRAYKLTTITDSHPLYNDVENVLQVVFENGAIIKEFTFEEIRKNAESNN